MRDLLISFPRRLTSTLESSAPVHVHASHKRLFLSTTDEAARNVITGYGSTA
ncbi:hypothetical protein LY78DRAFT_653443 [Colletotrichum sublineola]|nr:hypothetical protein LY78DRAFT_653443 [Colletotrichum sublineola]